MSELELWDPKKHHVHQHGRVRSEALDQQRTTERWANRHGIELEVSSMGHHWRFRVTDTRHVAEWWPSSGKLVVEAKYKKALHAVDIDTVKAELVRRWDLRSEE